MLGYGLDDRGLTPGRGRDCFYSHRVHTGTEAHTTSCPKGTGSCFPESKAAGTWSWLLTFIYRHASALPYVFMVWYLIKHGDNFSFIFTVTNVSSCVFFSSPSCETTSQILGISFGTLCMLKL